MECRICGERNAIKLGSVSTYCDYNVEILQCPDCGSRFAPYKEEVYEFLHATANSTYEPHKALARAVSDAFRNGDCDSIRRLLIGVPKYRYVIENIEKMPLQCKILEVGCSSGYLTAYFNSIGFNATGMDVSSSAIADARSQFGEHYCTLDEWKVFSGPKYEVVVLVGTIGCVEDPVGLLNDLSEQLSESGVILMNAPNRNFADRMGVNHVWPFTTSPPDLITAFAPEFWSMMFSDDFDVETQASFSPARNAVVAGLLEKWNIYRIRKLVNSSKLRWRLFKAMRLVVTAFAALKYSKVMTDIPAEYGLYVKMTRKSEHGRENYV